MFDTVGAWTLVYGVLSKTMIDAGDADVADVAAA